MSSQFHVCFNPNFNTLRQETLELQWQWKTYFASAPGTAEKQKKRAQEPEGVDDHSQTPAKRMKGIPSSQHDVIQLSDPPEPPRVEETMSRRREQVEGTPSRLPPTNDTTATTSHQPAGQTVQDGAHLNQPLQPTVLMRSGRVSKPVRRLIEIMLAEHEEQEIPGELFSTGVLAPDETEISYSHPLTAYKAMTSSNPDSMYYHQAMREPNADWLIVGMQQEMDCQFEDGNFSLVHKSQIPKGQKVFRAVWQMHRKRNITTREIKGHKG